MARKKSFRYTGRSAAKPDPATAQIDADILAVLCEVEELQANLRTALFKLLELALRDPETDARLDALWRAGVVTSEDFKRWQKTGRQQRSGYQKKHLRVASSR